ncbi:dentin matrix acidic phosphoprotein 1-like [Ranitomeya imitator]|uniref:dentin matrix acidic phosphoprotein 1-like n=1 Tax=Ranitomeya imitator TaxID=111125 RepID=UPI0037E80F96
MIIIPVVLGLLLIIIVIVLIIYFKRKKQRIPAELKIGDIIVPDLILNCRAELECPIYNYKLGEHTVEWYGKKQDAEELIPIGDHRRLQTVDQNDNNAWIAYLALTPVKTEDDKIKYICKVKGSRQTVEARANTKELRVTEQKSLLNNEKEKSRKSPEKNPSQKTPDNHMEAWDPRWIKTLDKERNPPALKNLGKEGFQSVNESSQIKEIKIPQIFSETATQQETKQLRNSYGHKITQRPENGKGQELCPVNELPGEEEMEEHSLSTNKTGNEKKMHPLEESCTNTEKEGVNQEHENQGTSHLITDLFTPQEIIASIGSSTEEGEEEMINIRKSLTKEGSDTEETSNEWRPKNREGEPMGDGDNGETSQLIQPGASSNKEGAGLKKISTEGRPQNSEEGSPGDGDNEETSQLIQPGASSNKEGAGLKEISTEGRPQNSEEGSPGDGDNEETSQLIPPGASSNKEGAGLKEISTEWRPENNEEGSPGDGDNEETSQLIPPAASSNKEGAGLKEISTEWRP